jgi:hypothetical protein
MHFCGFSSAYRSEILAAAIHEYTDWERPVQHPISVRDETLDALTDAQVRFYLSFICFSDLFFPSHPSEAVRHHYETYTSILMIRGL